MTKVDTLYFIRILQEALKNADKKMALLSAFEEIKNKAGLPEYQQGYRNFESFMKIIDDYVSSSPDYIDESRLELIESRILDFATETFKGSDADKQQILEFIKGNPDLYSEYERIRGDLKALLSGLGVAQIEIEKDGRLLGTFKFDKESNTILIKEVTPGDYSIRLSTGRLLWEGKLSGEDLIWAKAHPEEKLPAAAETMPIHSKPTLTEPMLGEELKLEIFPWLGSGVLLLTLRKIQ